MVTDTDLNAIVIASLTSLYDMLSCTEGDPLNYVGNVYAVSADGEEKPYRLVVTGYTDELTLEGFANGALAPVITRLYVVQKREDSTLSGQYLVTQARLGEWELVDHEELQDTIIATPTFVVRRQINEDPPADTTFFIS